jgi:uncharacterized phage protein gp47/JayE
MIPSPPTGITIVAYNNRVEISWVKNPETDIKGYNVYNSTTSGGGLSGYVKINNTLIETYSEVRKEVYDTQEVIEESGNTRTTSKVELFEEVYIFRYAHENLTEKKKQYYIITAVNNTGEESVPSIEVETTPLSIPTEIVEIPTRTQNDISLDYITEILERDDKLDVKPGSVIRQLHVDPNSREMSWAFIRESFAMRSQSFLTLRALDDQDGDGISDPVEDSTYKQQLKQAYFFENDSDVQELIDDSFESLAANYGKIRQAATKSSTKVVFFASTSPTTDVTVPLGEEISTVPTETQAAIKFKTLSSGTMEVDQIDSYYNPVTQRYELTIPIEAVEPGAIGNVNANTIINTNIAGLSVTNPESAFGGEDEESNADLADRAQLSFVGLDVGTVYGYKRTCTEIPGVRDVMVIDAGHSLMQRDYDEVRKKHVFGKVDIYIRGGENTQTEDKVGFLYKQSVNESFSIDDPDDMIISTSNSSVSTSTPIYIATSIRNVSKGKDYDLLGNWMISKNGNDLQKRTQVNLDLTTGEISLAEQLDPGDVIMANYQYKSTISGEIVIDPANGGEVNFSLDHFPIVKRSYEIIKNGLVLVDNIDYYLNLTNGFLQLSSGLSTGDVVTANYQYVITISNESVISSASGGEISATLANQNILESILIGLDGVSLDLEEHNEINSSIGMLVTDLINVTYRYRDSEPILLLTQPAEEIISIIGSISGSLESGVNYELNKIDDILLEGNSSKAQRTVKITYANGIPIGDLVNSSENIVLVNNEYKELSQYGIDTETVIVRKGSTTYLRNSDYLIMPEGEGKKVQLARSRTSTIPNGEEIEVVYDFGEILTITYEANPLVNIAQNAVDVSRHVTADVLVKQVLETEVDLDISVVLETGSDSLKVSSDIRTAVSNEFNKLKLGMGIAQSDVIRAIEEVDNVKSVVVPLTKMTKSDGTQVNREVIASTFEIYQTNTVVSYTTGLNALLNKTLGHLAGDGFYAIFEDDRPLTLVSSPNDVDSAAGQGFISSDGEIIISTLESDPPTLHTYTVSYVVHGETGAKDISVTSLEFLSVGEIIITTA